ncbi:MAG: S-layer homology domain-containing protein, partial [Oscillospiraceae bacterium]
MKNLKKVIALVAVFAMMVSTVAFAQTFNDVKSTDNYYEAIETLSKLGIITGDDQNNDGVMDFRPNDTITRAEVAVIVSRIQGMNSLAPQKTTFTDVAADYWAAGYIASAASLGIVNGMGDGTFEPETNVKYEEVIKMLMVTLGYEPFAAQNGGYPTGYITAAQRHGVIDGVVGGGVGTDAPRGMVAQMTYNAIDTPLMDRYTY